MGISIIKKEILIIVVTSLLAIGLAGCNEKKGMVVVKGSFMDSRDGKTYKTVKIGDQIWMAENLNFETEDSYCYNDSAEYCTKYGRLYTFESALDACPAGWHLPSKRDFAVLFWTVGGKDIADKNLKSASGWEKDRNGSDVFGFSLLPAGRRKEPSYYNGEFSYADEFETAFIWTSDAEGDRGAYVCYIMIMSTLFPPTDLCEYKKEAYSVRCLKD